MIVSRLKPPEWEVRIEVLMAANISKGENAILLLIPWDFLTVAVHAANVHDSKGAMNVISTLKGRFSRLVKIVADGGYRGELIDKTKAAFGFVLDIVLRPDESPKFKVIPKRWVVERTFAWFESYRRLSNDFEYLTDTSETMIQIAMIKLMLNRIK